MVSNASNVRQGTNPDFTISDFLKLYPQFNHSGISTLKIALGGTLYAVNDLITVLQAGSSGTGSAVVSAVDVSGAITGIAIKDLGWGYTTGTNLLTSTSGSGSGATVNITVAVIPPSLVPPDILQMFVDMANSSILEVRFHSQWAYAMCLYIAHFCALYVQSQSGMNQTAAQVINTAQAVFPKSSKSVGDVSVSYDTSSILGDMPGWGAWKMTSYGIQLATIARLVGKGGMYVR